MNRKMCVKTVFSAAVCAVVAFAAAECMGAKPATSTAPATGPAKVSPAAALAGYIKVIKTEKDPSLVLRAYTKACAINRMDPQLNSVYMRRMLRLGRPRAAYMSARILSRLDDADAGLAWAVMGYMMGRSNKYLDAMTATARALEYNSGDPSILNNAGQLAAWFDNAPAPPKLGDREKRVMDKLKDKLQKSRVYTDAYARINSVYATSKSQRADLESKLTTAETGYNKARAAEATMRADIKRINSQIIKQNEKIEECEKEIRRNRNRMYAKDELGRYIYSRRDVMDENTRLQRGLENAENKKDALRKEGAPIVPKIKAAAIQGAKLRKDISVYRTTLKTVKPMILRRLRWDPPRVDGVFTPETTSMPRKIKPPTTRPAAKVATGSDAEIAATKRLKLAKLYASNDKYQKAREIILDIVGKYPKTKAAAQAKVLLEKLSEDRPSP